MGNSHHKSVVNEDAEISGERDDEQEDFSPFFEYLQSAEGHQIASRIVGLIEDIKKATLDKNYSHATLNRWLEAGVLVVVIGVIAVLSVLNKLNPTVGVVLGSVVGYFFGRNK